MALLLAGAAALGTAAAARRPKPSPRNRLRLRARAAARLLPELAAGWGVSWLLTGRWWSCLLAFALAVAVRRQGYGLARQVARLRLAGNPTTVLRARAAVARRIPATLAVLALAVLAGGLDRRGLAPLLVLPAAAGGLLLWTGAEHQALQARFRLAGAVADADLGAGWGRLAGGLVGLLVATAALLPPPPALLPLGRLAAALGAWAVRLDLFGPPAAPPAAPRPFRPPPAAAPRWAQLALGAILLLAVAAVLVQALVRWRRSRHPAGQPTAWLGDLRRTVGEALRAAWLLLLGFGAALREEFAGGSWLGVWALGRQALAGLLAAVRRWLRPARRGKTPTAAPAPPAGPTAATAAEPARVGDGLPADGARRRVRERYRAFAVLARQAGLPRLPGQTPAAHRHALELAEPGMAEGLAELTGAYEWARFSPHPVGPVHIAAAERGWRLVAPPLRARAARREASGTLPARPPAPGRGRSGVGTPPRQPTRRSGACGVGPADPGWGRPPRRP
jgi:hypothetical protein